MSATPRPGATRRHLLVLLALTAVAAVGAALVVTGHRSTRTAAPTTTTSTTTIAPGPAPAFLGTFGTDAALRNALRALDPRTLRRSSGGPATTAPGAAAPVTARSVERCKAALQHAGDVTLGAPLRSAWARVAATPVLYVTFRVPAAGGRPASIRGLAADASTCRVRFAISY